MKYAISVRKRRSKVSPARVPRYMPPMPAPSPVPLRERKYILPPSRRHASQCLPDGNPAIHEERVVCDAGSFVRIAMTTLPVGSPARFAPRAFGNRINFVGGHRPRRPRREQNRGVVPFRCRCGPRLILIRATRNHPSGQAGGLTVVHPRGRSIAITDRNTLSRSPCRNPVLHVFVDEHGPPPRPRVQNARAARWLEHPPMLALDFASFEFHRRSVGGVVARSVIDPCTFIR